MATIKYNGMELEEFTSDKPVIFDPPIECICWDEEKDADYHNKEDDFVLAYKTTERSLADRVRSREIPHIKDGKSTKFKREDLDAYMESHRIVPMYEIKRAV